MTRTRPTSHVFVLNPDAPPFCRCNLPKRNKIHVPPKDRTIPLF